MPQGAGRSHQPIGSAPPAPVPSRRGLIWLLSLLISTLAVTVAFIHFDVPVARGLYGSLRSTQNLARGLTSAVLLSGEAAVALTLIVIRITRGRVSPFGEAAALACLTSICAYSMNDSALKFLFGVPNPDAVLHGARHALHLMSGSSNSTFPSGHMVLSGAFAGVFMRLYRRSTLALSALLFLGALLLVGGDWHFISDVIAGTFIGVSAGLLAGELWSAHAS